MTPAFPVVLERDNVNDDFVILVRWFAGHGDKVEANTLLAEVETSKASLEVYAPKTGFLAWEFPEGATVPLSSPIGHISADPPAGPPQFNRSFSQETHAALQHGVNPVPTVPQKNAMQSTQKGYSSVGYGLELPSTTEYRQRVSPIAAKMMEEHGLTAANFAGKSIVRKQDVYNYLNPPSASPIPTRIGAMPAVATKIVQPYTEIHLSRMKRSETSTLAAGVRNAIQSKVSVICFTQGLRRILETSHAGWNASAVIVFEVSRLLRKYPSLNATYREGAMLQYEQVNLGYAMDDGHGLKVAVLQNCDLMSLDEITAALRELTVAYLEDKLTLAQTVNSTFVISDLSGMEVSSFYPLISENQGGILGVGGEQFAPNSTYGTYTLILTFDHQLSNGRTAALFLNSLKERLLSYESTIQETQQEMTCSQCGRTATELAALNYHLLRSALPEGYLCTFCMAGY